MKKKLSQFIIISILIHVLIGLLFLYIHLFKQSIIKKKPENSNIFFSDPKEIPPISQPEIKKEAEKNLESYIVQPKTTLETKSEQEFQTMPSPIPTQKKPEFIEKPEVEQKAHTIQNDTKQKTITKKLKEPTQEHKTEELIIPITEHIPEKQIATKQQEPILKQIQTTPTYSQEELKQLALQSLLKKDQKPQTTYAPTPISPPEYFALKKAEQDQKNTVGYSVEASLQKDINHLALSTYQKKFIEHLVTSYHIMRSKTQYKDQKKDSFLTFMLETDLYGKILLFAINESCGNPAFDKLFSDAVAYAEPFPPIPKHLNTHRFRLGSIKINV